MIESLTALRGILDTLKELRAISTDNNQKYKITMAINSIIEAIDRIERISAKI